MVVCHMAGIMLSFFDDETCCCQASGIPVDKADLTKCRCSIRLIEVYITWFLCKDHDTGVTVLKSRVYAFFFPFFIITGTVCINRQTVAHQE